MKCPHKNVKYTKSKIIYNYDNDNDYYPEIYKCIDCGITASSVNDEQYNLLYKSYWKNEHNYSKYFIDNKSKY